MLAGVTPGAHPALYQYYIRRMRMASNDPLVQVCKDKGYPVEFVRNFDGTFDYNTVVVSFPCSVPEGTTTSKELSAVEHLQFVSRLQSIWSDNAVSCTIYYRPDELPGIKAWLAEHYEHEIKSVSFLLANDHGFEQAPYEEITEEEYHRLVESVEPLVSIEAGELLDDLECSNGVCPVK